jgi:hypothetical protein
VKPVAAAALEGSITRIVWMPAADASAAGDRTGRIARFELSSYFGDG